MPDAPELACYLHEGWAPDIRPASHERQWMNETPYSYANRCLPLTTANSHGWTYHTKVGFDAVWDGRQGKEGVRIKLDEPAPHSPVSLFGSGTITVHIEGIFQTSPGWNLWVGGTPNFFIHGAQPLTGLVETDWSPFTFTMNWKLTKAREAVRFPKGTPICHFFPVPRGVVDGIVPRYARLDSNPALLEGFRDFKASKDAFHAKIALAPPLKPRDQYQGMYIRGETVAGEKAPEHQTRVRPRAFILAPEQ